MTQIPVKNANGDTVNVELPLAPGRAAAAASRPVALSNEDFAVIGGLTETAPATDTASSGLNGRMQRVAQRLTSLIALLPTTIGGKTGVASLGVTLASDDPAVVTLGATTGAAVITDANGTVQQYLRGLVKRWVDALGTGTAAAALRVTVATDVGLPAGTGLLGKVKTKFIEAAAGTMQRLNNTTAYVANEGVSNNATAGSVTPFSFSMSDVNDDLITIERLRLITSDTGVAGKAMRMWLYRASPTVNSGDHAAFSQPRSTFIGTLSGTMRTFSDGSGGIFVPDEGSRIITLPTSGLKTVFGLLQTLDAFTPVAQSTWIATLEGFQGAA